MTPLAGSNAPAPGVGAPVIDLRSTANATEPAEARAVRNALVEQNRSVVDPYVRRYTGRGVPPEDLRQVALLALVQAADRFDPDRGTQFRTFAGRTIDGTLKRHFRDHTWGVRPPRSLQELHLRVRKTNDELAQRWGRAPTIAELARELEVDLDDVHAALEAGMAHGTVSVDAPVHQPDDEASEPDFLGTIDPGYESTDRRLLLGSVLDGLDHADRELLRMRFVDERTQQEIAEHLGISQSLLSRRLRSLLSRIREQIDGDEPA